jgi:hypothetical protein
MIPEAEVFGDGRTVWVNSGTTGASIGRFSWAGIDIHHDAEEQLTLGKQCLDCKRGPTTLEDWVHFVDGMKQHFGAIVPQSLMPRFLAVKEFA